MMSSIVPYHIRYQHQSYNHYPKPHQGHHEYVTTANPYITVQPNSKTTIQPTNLPELHLPTQQVPRLHQHRATDYELRPRK